MEFDFHSSFIKDHFDIYQSVSYLITFSPYVFLNKFAA